jgi:tetratricopeptide (TPR) repeat protein
MMLQANQPSNEVFMNLFMIWGVAMWLRADSAQASGRYYAATGLLLGLVTLIKPALSTMVLMVLAWVLAEGLNPVALKRRAWSMIWVLLPIVTLWGLMVLYFVWPHRATELYDCLVRYAVFYAKNGNQGNSVIWMNIWHGLGKENFIPSYMIFLIPLMALTVWGIWGGLRGRQCSQALILAGWLFGTFLAISIPGRFYPHYYQLYLPVLAVGAGWGIVTAAGLLPRWAMGQWLGAGTLLFLFWHTAPDYRYDGKTWSRLTYNGDLFSEFERCGIAVNQMLKTNECFYAWGADPSVYYYSDRRPASGIFWADRLLDGPSKTEATQKVIADLEKTRPPLILIENNKYLVLSSNILIYKWVMSRYVESPESEFSRYFSVYLRRDSALLFRISTNQQPFVLGLADVGSVFLRQTAVELLHSGRTNEAAAYLKKAVEIDHNHPDFEDYKNLGDDLLTKGQTDAAIRQLREILRLKPDYADAHNLLGLALVKKGQIDEAINEYQDAIHLDPDGADAHYNLGVALGKKGQIDEAINQYQDAIRLKPDLSPAHNNLGNALISKGQIDEAIRQLREAIRLNPDYAEAHNNLGIVLANKGQIDEAISEFQVATRSQPDFVEAHNNLANALASKGQIDEAINEFQAAIRCNPDYAVFYNNLANALASKGRLDEAIRQYQEAIRLRPDYAGAHCNLGLALISKGQLDGAISQFQEALRLQPDFNEASNNLARSLELKNSQSGHK